MAETATRLPVKNEPSRTPAAWQPFESLRKEVERLFDDFRFDSGRSFLQPLPSALTWDAMPAVDVGERGDAYEITAELPGMDEKDIEVRYADGVITITGEKNEEHEEKKKGYYVSERRFGSFRRSFAVPAGVDADKLEAKYAKGVLTVTLPKSSEAKKKEKKIPVSAK